MATATQSKSTSVLSTLNAFSELPREAALATFRATVASQDASTKMVRSLIDASLANQEAANRFAKDYLTSMYAAQVEWMKKSTEIAEKVLTASPSLD